MPLPDDIRRMRWYHGVNNEAAYAEILADRQLEPGKSTGMGWLAPVPGRVYLTSDPEYALIYALGGVMMGHDWPKERWTDSSRHGYIFEVRGEDLGDDIQPDEDSIGEMLYGKRFPWLNSIAKWVLAESTYDKVMGGEYAYWAKAGKVLVKRLTPEQKYELIRAGANIAHAGPVRYHAIGKVDKARSKDFALQDYPDTPEAHAKRVARIWEVVEPVTKGRGRGYWSEPGKPHRGRPGAIGGSLPRGAKHHGPGSHPGTGTPQAVHGGGAVLPTPGQLPLFEDTAEEDVPRRSLLARSRSLDEFREQVIADRELRSLQARRDELLLWAERRTVFLDGVWKRYGTQFDKLPAEVQAQVTETVAKREKLVEELRALEPRIFGRMVELLRAEKPISYKPSVSDDRENPASSFLEPDEYTEFAEIVRTTTEMLRRTVDSRVLADYQEPAGRKRLIKVAMMNIGGASWYTPQYLYDDWGVSERGDGKIHLGLVEATDISSTHSVMGTLAHEFGHWLEDRVPGAKTRLRDFQVRRAGRTQAIYDAEKREHRRKDSFLDDYMERVYIRSDGSETGTEIGSCALEMLFTRPVYLAGNDPELFRLIVSLISGRPEK